jgi:hypothetical protein
MGIEQERARYREQYQKLQEALLCRGLRRKTIDAYSRGMRRVAGYFKHCSGDLTPDGACGVRPAASSLSFCVH